MAFDLAAQLVALAQKEKIPLVFKASYDKANRTSGQAFRGPGLAQGLEILAGIKEKFGVPILTDVHQVSEVQPARGSGRYFAAAGVFCAARRIWWSRWARAAGWSISRRASSWRRGTCAT